LSREQAALLAGAIINPRLYSPANPRGRLLRRQQIILARMPGYEPPAPAAVPVPAAEPNEAPEEPAVPVEPSSPTVIDGDEGPPPAEPPPSPSQPPA
jgi:membrane peptidoglycan carboxypeptidase